MQRCRLAIFLLAQAVAIVACTSPKGDAPSTAAAAGPDPGLAAFIGQIRAVDNHSHVNSVAPDDADSDALPLDGIAPFEMPAPLHPDNPDWLAAYKALYNYPHADLSDAHMTELRATMQGVARAEGDKFPEWVLDRVGTEVLLANRIAMGPGLRPPRVRWVSFADPLMLPLDNTAEAATTPDRQKLFPLEDRLLQRYMASLGIARRPPTLDAYLKTVVTPTLEAQMRGGAVAVKFEIAYLRALDFDEATAASAGAVYARYARGGVPPRADYKTLQDFLIRYIAREAGRLRMAVHIHSFEGAGNFYRTAGSDPLLMEPMFNDPALRETNFVIVHGGGVFADRAGAMLWKPNVYADISMMPLAYTPARLAEVLRGWLTKYPEKVLFGTDAAAFGPDMGWELAAWVGTKNARAALASALSDMVRSGEVTRARAEEIATLVMRMNASRMYGLGLR